jgi:xylulokinase
MLDEAGAVLRPALIWCDTRTQPECDWLTEKIGYERLIELTCNPALPNFTLTKLLWVKTHQPEIFAKIRHVMCPKDYVRYRLTGEFAIDVQEASGTLLLDVTHRRWSREVAEAAGIDMNWLPKLYESPEICARISEKAAGLTGLTAGTPVAAGAGDQGAGAVGMGILQPGSVSATIGTSGVVFAATAAPTKDPKCGVEPELAAWCILCRPKLRRAQRCRGKGPAGMRRPGVGALSAGRAHAASRP